MNFRLPVLPLVEKRGLIIAGGFALAAAILTMVWLNQTQAKLKEEARAKLESIQENTVSVVFAKTEIHPGRLISEDMLYTRLVSKNNLPPEAVTSIARVIDRISKVPISKDTLISTDILAWPTTRETTLAMKTPIGKRAMTISVDNISALLGMIKPGDYVDVIGLIPLPVEVEGKQSAQAATVPLFQNVLILAVGSQLGTAVEKEGTSGRRRQQAESETKESAPLITLALSPEEANILAFVKEQGKVQLVLRSAGDAQTTPVQPVSWETVLKYLFPNMELEKKQEQKEEIKKEEPPQVEIIRGFKKEMMPLSQGK